MNTAIIITAIICGTIVLLQLISIIGSIIAAKKATKGFKDFFKEDK